MSLQTKIPKKIDLTPKKHHGFHALLILFGFLLPPVAVALRFGIGMSSFMSVLTALILVGTDFFINVFLTICGYFPSHGHNFYIQNIRNNENRGRTPKWAAKAGFIDTDNMERRKRKNAWATRYDERNLESAHVGQALEEGEEGDNYAPISEAERIRAERRQREGLWADDDAGVYNEDEAPNQRHWHYPANFEGAEPSRQERKEPRSRGSVDSITGATAYGTTRPGGHDDDVPEWGKDYGSARKPASRNPFNRKKSKQPVSDWHDDGDAAGSGSGGGYGTSNSNGRGYADDVAMDDGWAGASGGGRNRVEASGGGGRNGGGGGAGRKDDYIQPTPKKKTNGDPNWEHEF